VAVSVVGSYEYSTYEGAVVKTTVVSGKITNYQVTNSAGGGAVIGGGLAGAAGGQPGAVKVGANGVKTTSTAGSALITIQVGSTSFSIIIGCISSPYYAGMTIQVADELLRSGSHQYVPNIACKGSVLPFTSMHINNSTSIMSTSTTSSSSTSTHP